MTWEEIIFWSLAGALLHSYILFPILLRILASFRKDQAPPQGDPPTVAIIMAAFNEEAVVREKIESVLSQDYPSEKMEIWVGSDASTDKTNAIVEEICRKDPRVKLKVFPQRSGKIHIINTLAAESAAEILVLTDANVIFEHDTLKEMLKHYADQNIGLVDTNMLHRGVRNKGIAQQEQTYIQTEVGTKNAEGKLWGCMMGPFGGCYSIRRKLFRPVPVNYLVDDFYINMQVLKQGSKCVNERMARVYEDVSTDLSEEFRRKIRIATGNYQNMITFFPMLFRFNATAFCFFSHKILRWLGPWFMLIMLLQNLYFLEYWCPCQTVMYKYTLGIGLTILTLPLFDRILALIGVQLKVLRYATHFLSMNLALFIGTFRYLAGVRSSIWQPTRRHQ